MENGAGSQQVADLTRSKDGTWLPGHSGNPHGKYSRAARAAQRLEIISAWAAPCGGLAALNAAQISLLHQAAELTLRRLPPRSEDATRAVNCVAKILAQTGLVTRGHPPLEPIEPDYPDEPITETVTRVSALDLIQSLTAKMKPEPMKKRSAGAWLASKLAAIRSIEYVLVETAEQPPQVEHSASLNCRARHSET